MERKHSGRKREVTFTRRMVSETLEVGPAHDGSPVTCIKCHGSILNGDKWWRVSAADGSYAVAVCVTCKAQAGGAL